MGLVTWAGTSCDEEGRRGRNDWQVEVPITKTQCGKKKGEVMATLPPPSFLAPGETPWRKESSKEIVA